MAQPEIAQLGTLYFIPVGLGDERFGRILPADVIKITHEIDEFIVENEKTARHFLSAINHPHYRKRATRPTYQPACR